MNTIKKIIIGILSVGFTFTVGIALAAVLQGTQGGTGIASSTAGNAGKFLQVASTSPFLTYTFATPSSSGSATTTINGLSNSSYTFAGAGGLTISTSGTNVVTFTQGSSGNGTITQATSGYIAFYSASTTISGTSTFTFSGASGNATATIVQGGVVNPACTVMYGTDGSVSYLTVYGGLPYWDSSSSCQ